MSEILQANIFFFIASIATVVFCILICFILYHVIKITKSVRSIVERIDSGSEAIAQDAEQVRAFIASGGLFSKIVQFIMGARGGPSKKRSRNKD